MTPKITLHAKPPLKISKLRRKKLPLLFQWNRSYLPVFLPTLHGSNFEKNKASHYLPTSHRSRPFKNSSIFRLFSLWWKIQILTRRIIARTILFHRRIIENLQPMAKYIDILECGSIWVRITRLNDRSTDFKLINWVGIYLFIDLNNYCGGPGWTTHTKNQKKGQQEGTRTITTANQTKTS